MKKIIEQNIPKKININDFIPIRCYSINNLYQTLRFTFGKPIYISFPVKNIPTYVLFLMKLRRCWVITEEK